MKKPITINLNECSITANGKKCCYPDWRKFWDDAITLIYGVVNSTKN